MSKTYTVPRWLKMGTPLNQSGSMEYSYGVDLQSSVIVRRMRDASDGSETWAVAHLTEDECEYYAHYDARGAYTEPSVDSRFFNITVMHEEE